MQRPVAQQSHGATHDCLASQHGYATYHRSRKGHWLHDQVRNKVGSSLTKGAQRMMARILTKSLEQGRSVQHALRIMMGKLMGERTISKQEKCHLIMSIPTVFCSFVNSYSRTATRMHSSCGDSSSARNNKDRRIPTETMALKNKSKIRDKSSR